VPSRNASAYPKKKSVPKKPTIPGAKTFKPRREFRAFLIFELARRGHPLPPDPTYVQLREAVERVLPPVAP
jgi:hypothetical protein